MATYRFDLQVFLCTNNSDIIKQNPLTTPNVKPKLILDEKRIAHSSLKINEMIKENMASSLKSTNSTLNQATAVHKPTGATPNLDKLVSKYYPHEKHVLNIPKSHAHLNQPGPSGTGTVDGMGSGEPHLPPWRTTLRSSHLTVKVRRRLPLQKCWIQTSVLNWTVYSVTSVTRDK